MSRIVILFKGKAKTNKINGVMNRVFFFSRQKSHESCFFVFDRSGPYSAALLC